jgi:hypothetical protein
LTIAGYAAIIVPVLIVGWRFKRWLDKETHN